MLTMYWILFLAVLHFVSSSEDQSHYGDSENTKLNSITLDRNILTRNSTYIEKAENMLRIPVLGKNMEEQKGKRKFKERKKSPKRTVQKIIKNNRIRSKKVFPHQVTHRAPPSPLPKKLYENPYVSMAPQNKKEEDLAMQSNLRKKQRKWNQKVPRYPMPFQKLQRKEYKFKRSVERDDLYVLQDLDEVEFVTSDKDYDVVKAHVKKYW